MDNRRTRLLRPPRTGSSSLVRSWGLGDSEQYAFHSVPKEGDTTWKYGFTRNPWDRVVSLYHLSWRESYPHGEFTEWVLRGMPGEISFGDLWEELLTQPTYHWLQHADWVGRFEEREKELERLCGILKRDFPEAHLGKSNRTGTYKEYFQDNQEAIEFVREKYLVDVHHYGYEF